MSVYVLLLLLVFSPVHCILICVDGSCELNTYIHFNGISVNRTHKTHNKIKRKQNQQNKRWRRNSNNNKNHLIKGIMRTHCISLRKMNKYKGECSFNIYLALHLYVEIFCALFDVSDFWSLSWFSRQRKKEGKWWFYSFKFWSVHYDQKVIKIDILIFFLCFGCIWINCWKYHSIQCENENSILFSASRAGKQAKSFISPIQYIKAMKSSSITVDWQINIERFVDFLLSVHEWWWLS